MKHGAGPGLKDEGIGGDRTGADRTDRTTGRNRETTARPNEVRVAHSYHPGFHLSLDASWDARSVAIFGPSGAGKTSILETIAGVRRLRRSRIVLNGTILEESDAGIRVPPDRRGIGWVPQDGSLFPHMTVAENVRFGLGRRSDRRGRDPLYDRAVEMLEIAPLLDRSPRDLSGGEAQRVALARALARGPSALLLDEPLASLDLPLRARIFPYLVRLRDEAGIPLVFVTHDAAEAVGLARHVLVMDRGALVASGSPEDILRAPAALRLLDLVGIENRLVVADSVASPAEGLTRIGTAGGLRIAAPAGIRAGNGGLIGIRAEDILIATARPVGLSAQNVIHGRIAGRVEESGRWIVTVRCGAGPSGGEDLRAAITRHAMTELGLEPGSEAWLVFKALSVHDLGIV